MKLESIIVHVDRKISFEMETEAVGKKTSRTTKSLCICVYAAAAIRIMGERFRSISHDGLGLKLFFLGKIQTMRN